MKKRLIILLTLVLVIFGEGIADAATSQIKIVVNSKLIETEVSPVLINGRVLVPLRPIFNSFGALLKWDQTSQAIIGVKGDKIIGLRVGQASASVNNNKINLDVPPKILNGRTLVPARFISESLGAKVDWNEKTKTVYINRPDFHPQYSNEQIKSALATNAIMKQVNGLKFDVLGGEPDSKKLAQIRVGLSDAWGINNKQEAVEIINWLKTEGHSKECNELLLLTKNKKDDEFIQLLNTIEDEQLISRLKFVRENQVNLSKHSLIGWDLCRLVHVAESCYCVGYLSYNEALEEIMTASTMLKIEYSSWRELGDAYLLGGLYWGWLSEEDHRYRIEVVQWLETSSESPWVKYKWTKYNFDEAEITVIAEFKATPVSIEDSNWVTSIAGGTDKTLNITYGTVELKRQKYAELTEQFIKISGENGSVRFLANSETTGWYDEGNYTKLRFIKTQFWSAKTLEGNTVVKDFNPPVKSVILKKNFDENQHLTSINVYFSNEGDSDSQVSWYLTDPITNKYQADMTTLVYNGDPTARN